MRNGGGQMIPNTNMTYGTFAHVLFQFYTMALSQPHSSCTTLHNHDGRIPFYKQPGSRGGGGGSSEVTAMEASNLQLHERKRPAPLTALGVKEACSSHRFRCERGLLLSPL